MDRCVLKIIFAFLLKRKYKAPLLSETQEQLVSKLASEFFFWGIILSSVEFHHKQKKLVRLLEQQRKFALMKQMTNKVDFLEISQALKAANIKFLILKGMALNSLRPAIQGIRIMRDIDLLVDKRDCKAAYELIRSLGYKYFNPDTTDGAKIFLKHHLPCMVNERGTLVEIHWRVTSLTDFEHCPLTQGNEYSYLRQYSNNTPPIDFLMAHTIYHGVSYHKLNLGPLFLFDLRVLYECNDYKWPNQSPLFKELKIETAFEKSKKLIDMAFEEDTISDDMGDSISTLLDGQWRNQNKILLSRAINNFPKIVGIMRFFAQIGKRLKDISHVYQVHWLSFKYLRLVIRDSIIAIKKLKL